MYKHKPLNRVYTHHLSFGQCSEKSLQTQQCRHYNKLPIFDEKRTVPVYNWLNCTRVVGVKKTKWQSLYFRISPVCHSFSSKFVKDLTIGEIRRERLRSGENWWHVVRRFRGDCFLSITVTHVSREEYFCLIPVTESLFSRSCGRRHREKRLFHWRTLHFVKSLLPTGSSQGVVSLFSWFRVPEVPGHDTVTRSEPSLSIGGRPGTT